MGYAVVIPNDLMYDLEIIQDKTGATIKKQIINITIDWIVRFRKHEEEEFLKKWGVV